MSGKPAYPVSELINEAKLTQSKFLIVEGPGDKSFYYDWLRRFLASDFPIGLVVESVENIVVDDDDVQDLELPRGNRSDVIYVSILAAHKGVDFLCIADRDAGHRVGDHNLPTLAWTDYPALESYLFTAEGLDVLNRTALGGRLPSGEVLVNLLGPVLRDLFTVRIPNESLPTPKIPRAVNAAKAKSGSAGWFDLQKAVSPDVYNAFPGYEQPESEDSREYAYGHDIAELMISVYANEIKNGSHIATRELLESFMRLSTIVGGQFDNSRLAASLAAWCRTRR